MASNKVMTIVILNNMIYVGLLSTGSRCQIFLNMYTADLYCLYGCFPGCNQRTAGHEDFCEVHQQQATEEGYTLLLLAINNC